jgi:type VI secretion system protein ImpB
VQITYDVEIGDAIEKAEIPFVVGIMADLSGFEVSPPEPDTRESLKSKARPFVEIDRDNFGDVMAKIAPALAITGALDQDGNDSDRLVFRSLDDFTPGVLVKRIKDLKDLQTRRTALRDVLTKLDSNDALYRDLLKRVKEGNFSGPYDAAKERLVALLEVKSGDPKAEPKADDPKAADPKADPKAADPKADK